MLRSARQQEQAVATKRSWSLVLFSVGVLKLAARTEDVGVVAPWGESIPVPSRTPFVGSVVRRDKQVLPVYDLASRLYRTLEEDARLCLTVRHSDGPLAVGIDDEIPSLHTVEVAEIKPSRIRDMEMLGSFESNGEKIDIIALKQLGKS